MREREKNARGQREVFPAHSQKSGGWTSMKLALSQRLESRARSLSMINCEMGFPVLSFSNASPSPFIVRPQMAVYDFLTGLQCKK